MPAAVDDSSETKQLRELNRNMERVLALLLRSISRDNHGLPLKEQIAILDGLGIRPISIAGMLGKKAKHINKELVAIRRAVKK
jgi:hypothetical protein